MSDINKEMEMLEEDFEDVDENKLEELKKKYHDNAVALKKLEVDDRKIDLEYEKMYTDRDTKKKELNQKLVLAGVDMLVKTGITVFGFVTLLTFEEKGSITSRLGNTVINWIAGRK